MKSEDGKTGVWSARGNVHAAFSCRLAVPLSPPLPQKIDKGKLLRVELLPMLSGAPAPLGLDF